MALCIKVLNILRVTRLPVCSRAYTSITATTKLFEDEPPSGKNKKFFQTEDNLIFPEDPDIFGTISKRIPTTNIEDEDDKKEEQFLQNKILPSQKLTTKQYADLIKQYLDHKRLKEAINVLEVRMLTIDKVKPENYIYNILIGACADVGYTKKAFKLFNEMKRRALKPTGDTYTCLFTACANSPWMEDGLKRAKQLREHMLEKGIQPNLTNYNAMIKAFGKCGDLTTAFQIVDEMMLKKIKIRVHTFNHLLMACITDKENGLRHALVVWRKMLKMREKPNIYSFNLMLRCVKDCNLGGKEDILKLLESMRTNVLIPPSNQTQVIQSAQRALPGIRDIQSFDHENIETLPNLSNSGMLVSVPTKSDKPSLAVVDLNNQNNAKKKLRMPNLLARMPEMSQVTALRDIYTVQEKFALIGGQEDFLKEMEAYNVKPDIKTFTQMLSVIEHTRDAELRLIDSMKSADILADIDYFNMLIKKRCLRRDYTGAYEVMTMIEEEIKLRKKKYHPLSKKRKLKPNIMTYGVLAMACRTKEDCDKLLNDMKEKHLKVNIEILGALMRQAAVKCEFGRVMEILNLIKEEKVKVHKTLLSNIEAFSEKCASIIDKMEKQNNVSAVFKKSYEIFIKFYKNWLKEIEVEAVLNSDHPWKQFDEVQPETVQRQYVEIKEPNKFYKRNRRYVKKYAPRI